MSELSKTYTNDKTRDFHNSRTIFAYYDDKLNFCTEKGLSHYEWLVGRGLFSDVVFEELVRGYQDETGVYFYAGEFETNSYVEDVAMSCVSCFDKGTPIYCGLIVGREGERWKPVKRLI